MKRRKIAVFISNIYGAMIREMQDGINAAALENDIKVIYFASFSDGFSSKIYNQYVHYDEGDVVSFQLANLDEFDGGIIVDPSFPEFQRNLRDQVIATTRIPIINIGSHDDRYYNVINNEIESYKRVVEHVVEKHGCKDIYHIAGRKETAFTFNRIDAFKQVLTEHNLPCGDERIYYGTLWRDCGEPGLEYILEQCRKNGKDHPDAIVCVNDYSAIGVADACRAWGLNVPGDIIVTGYDGVEAAYEGFPTITTSEQPFYEAGKESVYALERLWNREKIPKFITTIGNLKCNQSCGCVPLTKEKSEDIRHAYGQRMGKMEYLAQSTTNMILSMSNSKSLDECYKEVERNAMNDTGFKDFLLCMAPGWDKQRTVGIEYMKTDEDIEIVAGFKNLQPVERMTIRKKDLLPKFMLDDPNPYYVVALHHLQYYMGYIIISPDIHSYNQLMAKSWLVNLGAMLENWRIRNELRVTVERLENLYNRDMLTDLYNRRGYEMFFGDYYKSCLEKQTNLAVMLIDMDDLKYVNDNLGHAEGDYSLCTIAEAMNVAATNGEICLRTGGDEFVVLAEDYSEEKANEYILKLREHISKRMERDKKRYALNVSIGICMEIPKAEPGVKINDISERYMHIADVAMYEEKKEHKKNKTN